ncbi:MAG: PAS domain S-box protein [Acidobacteriota bacterium]|nr:PAS domain S-box protein [Acidobacteriota bacterium]
MFLIKRILAFLLLFGIAASIKAEQLPIKIYTSADGLASGAIFHVSRDSRGFLWFSTRDGLSRFDGREFVNYRLEGTDAPNFNATLETRDGWFWIAAGSGLYRIKPDATGEVRPEVEDQQTNLFRIFKAEKVSKTVGSPPLFEDSRGRLWLGGGEPLLISENGELKLQKFDLGEFARSARGAIVYAFHESRDKSLWFGCETGMVRLLPDGRRILYPIERQTGYDETRSIVEDEAGRIWVAHRRGVFVFQPETLDALADAQDLSARTLSVKEKIIDASGAVSLPEQTGKMLRLMFVVQRDNSVISKRQSWNIDRIFRTSDGQIWIPASGSLFVFEQGSIRHLKPTDGFPRTIQYLGEDAENNVWIATEGGALRFDRRGLTTWGFAEGLVDTRVHSFIGNPDGGFYIVHGDWRISRLTEKGIETAQLQIPEAEQTLWTSTVAFFDSARKNWWGLSSGGLYRFPMPASDLFAVGLIKPAESFGVKDGFKSDLFYCAFRDSAGNIWFSTRDTVREHNGLARLNAETGKFQFFSLADGFPEGAAMRSFAEDRAGNLWFGFYGGGLMRYRNGRFTDFSNVPGAPKGGIFALHLDAKGRLWIGSTRDGLTMAANPTGENPIFKNYTTVHGLASNNVRVLTEDLAGNIYVGTIRGVDRLNPETGSIRHYSTADGLASDSITSAFRDRDGAIWFGTFRGVSKLDPQNDSIAPTRAGLRVLINSLQIAGKDYSVSEFGRETIENIRLSSAENNLQIQFLSVGSGLRYQYRLEGGEKDWSTPTTERTVNFAGLAPGSYKFLVRAIDENNQASEKPAIVSFSIAQPFWITWEFIGSLILIAGFGVFLLDRYRVSKTRQVRAALAKSLESEKIARESETRFRTLAQTASDAIITIDVENQIVFVNDAVEKIFGFSAEELLGKPLTLLMPDKFQDAHNAGLQRYVSSNAKNIPWVGIELIGRHQTGREIPLEVSFGEFTLDGKRYFTGIARDVSERKRAEEAIQKAREERMKELQKVRTRIATDLHDDIGSSLTQIAVLSEVARSQALRDEVRASLERISDVSNELVDAMADVVWAINPKKDSLRELVLRMRRFASDVLSAKDIEFELEAPETDSDIQFGANIRREVFSIYKECINNIVRHSGATEVFIEFEIIVGVLRLKIADNGRGFDVKRVLSNEFSPDKGGNGLINIRRRVSDLNGTFEINSSDSGTVIALYIPLLKEQEEISLTIRTDSDKRSGNGKH